jgi:hypothetical protein
MAQFGEAHDSTHRLIDAHIKAAELADLDHRTGESRTTMATATVRPGTLRTPRASTGASSSRGGATLWMAVVGMVAGIVALAIGGMVWVDRGRSPVAPPAPPLAATTVPSSSGAASITCPAGFKACAGACVSIDRPDVGCGSDECAPCEVAQATPRCNSRHACDIAVCYPDYDNCDGDLHNGCETEVRTDPNNCGACGRKCPALPHAKTGCGDTCTIWRCDDGFHDCNGAVGDGCEVHTSDDARNCGHCGLACAPGKRCRAGRCVL